MRIAFIGTVEFSYSALQLLIEEGYEVVTVLTKEGSNFNADFKDLTSLCNSHNIPYKFVINVNDFDNLEYLASFKPDIIYCFGWSGLLKKEVLTLAPKGVVGFHPAKLPFNKGRHPIIWALALGLAETASTFFIMDEGADTGDIISQQVIKIEYADNASTLYNKITSVALSQIRKFTPELLSNNILKIEQNKSEGNSWRKRGKKDGEIDFRMSSRAIYNLVRALTLPYVGAHITLPDGQEIKVWEVEESDCDEANLESGKVISTQNKEIEIKCGDGCVILKKHEFEVLPLVGTYL